MLFDDTLRSLLQGVRSIALVGAKDKAGQDVDRVGRYLIAVGYTLYPVHPVRRDVWGLPTFASLAELPEAVDMVNVFRAPQHCAEHAKEILSLAWKPRIFWMQEGIRSPEAGMLMQQAGIQVIEDRCIMVDHRNLLGVQS